MASPIPERGLAPIPLENRCEPRFIYRLTMEANGLELCSTNVSKNGFQLCCPVMRYNGLLAGRSTNTLLLSWQIPGALEQIKASGVERYANACEDEILIGVELIEFCGRQNDAWCAFVDSLAAARGG